MSYRKHIFFCTNQRSQGRQCCQDADAAAMRLYAKQTLKDKESSAAKGIRVNAAGCLGFCAQGPALVIYPEGVWYTYHNKADIDEIIQEHIIGGKLVSRLLIHLDEDK